jgi:NADH-quinone oxidoreductase subunit J
VAVLFLFVVMMLDVDFAELRHGLLNYLPIGFVVGAVLLAELLFVVATWVIEPGLPKTIAAPIAAVGDVTNTQALGLVLYTRYVYFFEAAGMILLVAMIGAIVMTLQHKPNVKRQIIADQLARHRSNAIEIVKVKSGQGLP